MDSTRHAEIFARHVGYRAQDSGAMAAVHSAADGTEELARAMLWRYATDLAKRAYTRALLDEFTDPADRAELQKIAESAAFRGVSIASEPDGDVQQIIDNPPEQTIAWIAEVTGINLAAARG